MCPVTGHPRGMRPSSAASTAPSVRTPRAKAAGKSKAKAKAKGAKKEPRADA